MPDPVIGEIASAIHVRHIQTPIGTAKRFRRTSRVADVLDHLETNKFDMTPVFPEEADREESKARDPDGLLSRTDLDRLRKDDGVGTVVCPLTSATLIESNASLMQLLSRFRSNHTFMLVVGSEGLVGIVTPSDLNKQAGRTHLFMQLSALELATAEIVRSSGLQGRDLLGLLSPDRASRARRMLQRKENEDQSADLVAALDLQDLLRITREIEDLGAFSRLTEDEVRALSDFRNGVMHAVLDPAGDERDRLEELLARTGLIDRLLGSVERGA